MASKKTPLAPNFFFPRPIKNSFAIDLKKPNILQKKIDNNEIQIPLGYTYFDILSAFIFEKRLDNCNEFSDNFST